MRYFLIFHLIFRGVILENNVLCHTEHVLPDWPFYNGLQVDQIFYDEETQVMQDMPSHLLKHRHTKDHTVTDLLTVISATSAFNTVG